MAEHSFISSGNLLIIKVLFETTYVDKIFIIATATCVIENKAKILKS